MTRAEELAAIAEHITVRGVTRCPPAFANAESSFVSMWTNRECAKRVKKEPTEYQALQRHYAVPGGFDSATHSRMHKARAEWYL